MLRRLLVLSFALALSSVAQSQIVASPNAPIARPSLAPIVLINAGKTTSPLMAWPGGQGLFAVAGTFGGATVTLQYLGPDGVTLINIGTAVSAAGVATFSLPPGLIQATVATAGTTTLTATAQPIPQIVVDAAGYH